MERTTFTLWVFFVSLSFSFSNTKAQMADSVSVRQTIFFDNFSRDVIGKFPSNWISNRPGEVVAPKSLPGKWFKMHAEGTYLPLLTQDLPKNFTIDFDFVHQAIGNGNNTTEMTIFGKPKHAVNDALFPGTCGIKIVLETYIVSCLCYDNLNPGNQVSAEYRSPIIQANHMAKVSIHLENGELLVVVNGVECFQVSHFQFEGEVFNAVRFYLWGSQAEPMISNFRIY